MKPLLFIALLVSSFVVVSCGRPSLPKQADITQAPLPDQEKTKAGWELEWQKALTYARKEGRVVVYGPPGADIRRALTEEFQKAYPGIEVSYTGAAGAQTVPKVKAERRAGLNIVDIHIGGTTSIITELKPFTVPVEPWLILPEVKDGKYWIGGKLDFSDIEGKYNLVFNTFAKMAMAYNENLLNPAKVKDMSYWDLTNPEFKGKIVMDDPRVAGPGQATVLFYYMEPKLGRNFIKALAANELGFSRDQRLVMEWVSRGKYAVTLGYSELMLSELQKAGLPNVKTQAALKEGTFAPNGWGSLIFFDGAPHPNAAKIYANWLLSREGQIIFSQATTNPSRRVDAPKEIVDPEILLKPGVSYLYTYKEDVIMKRGEVLEAIYEIFGRS